MSIELTEAIKHAGRPLVVPLMGYPGTQLTGSTLRQNLFNAELQFLSLSKLVDRFHPDGIFIMMDLSVEAGAIGIQVRYPTDAPPSVESHPVRSAADLDQFRVLDPLQDARVQSFIAAMARVSENLSPLKGGYVCGPFTLASLMMGANEMALATVDDPELVLTVVEFAEDLVTRYAKALAGAGADMVAILEPSASMLSARAFDKFVRGHIERMVREVPATTILHVCGKSAHLVPAMVASGVRGLSLDFPVDLPKIASDIPPDVALLGNIDPVRVMTDGDELTVRSTVHQLLDAMRPYPNFVLSTGCDLPAATPLANISAFMKAAQEWS